MDKKEKEKLDFAINYIARTIESNILIAKINNLVEQEHSLVNNGMYAEAIKVRDKEQELRRKVITLEELEKVREKLNDISNSSNP